MTTTKVAPHTPGPWRVEMGFIVAPEPWDKMYVAKAYEPHVMEHLGCFGPSQSYNDVEAMARANAQLIAAAPEMLEALRLALVCLDAAADGRLDDVRDEIGGTANLVDEAIAKATHG